MMLNMQYETLTVKNIESKTWWKMEKTMLIELNCLQ